MFTQRISENSEKCGENFRKNTFFQNFGRTPGGLFGEIFNGNVFSFRFSQVFTAVIYTDSENRRKNSGKIWWRKFLWRKLPAFFRKVVGSFPGEILPENSPPKFSEIHGDIPEYSLELPKTGGELFGKTRGNFPGKIPTGENFPAVFPENVEKFRGKFFPQFSHAYFT